MSYELSVNQEGVTVTIDIIHSARAPLSSFGPAERMVQLMQGDFGFPIKNRLGIAPEVHMYKIKEDESVFNQVKTEKYDYQVFWDGEFVCAFNITEHPQRVRINILKGLKRLIQAGKIFWNVNDYQKQADEQKYREKRARETREAKRVKPTTKEEKIVHAAIRKAVKLDK